MTSRRSCPFSPWRFPTLIVVGAMVPALPAEAASEPPFVLYFLKTPSPVFSSTFGASRSSGRRHQGNDLMAPKMTHVYAAAAGIVTVIDTHGSAGRYVEIQHKPDGRPLSPPQQRRSGDGQRPGRLVSDPGLGAGSGRVTSEAGQHIGYVGDSGNAEWTGSHTAFRARPRRREVDPTRSSKMPMRGRSPCALPRPKGPRGSGGQADVTIR